MFVDGYPCHNFVCHTSEPCGLCSRLVYPPVPAILGDISVDRWNEWVGPLIVFLVFQQVQSVNVITCLTTEFNNVSNITQVQAVHMHVYTDLSLWHLCHMHVIAVVGVRSAHLCLALAALNVLYNIYYFLVIGVTF